MADQENNQAALASLQAEYEAAVAAQAEQDRLAFEARERAHVARVLLQEMQAAIASPNL